MSEMKNEDINHEKLIELENRLGCTFCSDGIFAEMSLNLADYKEKTRTINEVDYGFYQGSEDEIKRAVALVDEGYDKAYIHYTHIDKWYEKLGYQTFARFSFR